MPSNSSEYSRRWREANPGYAKRQYAADLEKSRTAQRIRIKRQQAANPDRWRTMDRARKLRHKYGLTLEQYNQLYAAQNGQCAICQGAGPLHLDHNHKTKAVRALLCAPCNLGLGQFRDDPQLLELAAVYLRRCKEQYQ